MRRGCWAMLRISPSLMEPPSVGSLMPGAQPRDMGRWYEQRLAPAYMGGCCIPGDPGLERLCLRPADRDRAAAEHASGPSMPARPAVIVRSDDRRARPP